MPDLQTEIFTKVLPNLNNIKFDDHDELETPMPATSEPIPLTRQVFEFIKTHPKCAGKEVLNFFTAAGHKRPVVAATVTALIKTNRAERLNGRLCLARNDYERPRVAKATAPKEKPETIKPNASDVWSVDQVLDGLTMYQGHDLYLKLKEIYGG